jgi:hypothetical protein
VDALPIGKGKVSCQLFCCWRYVAAASGRIVEDVGQTDDDNREHGHYEACCVVLVDKDYPMMAHDAVLLIAAVVGASSVTAANNSCLHAAR